MVASEYILAVLDLAKIGDKRALNLIAEFGDIPKTDECYDKFLTFAGEKHPKWADEWDADKSLINGKRILSNSRDQGIEITTYWDDSYPASLKATDNPPLCLHHKGKIGILNDNTCVAVVGTRKPTDYGGKCARGIGRLLSENGVCVISGLALGCDTQAHRGSLDANGLTAAVMPCGLDKITPKENLKLSEEIVRAGGLLISSFPVGTDLRNGYYVVRDKIQAALSKFVVVVETAVDGGTLHAVEHARKIKRTVACVDSHPDTVSDCTSVQGNHMLIREQKALPVKAGVDVLKLLESPGSVVERDGSENRIQGDLNL